MNHHTQYPNRQSRNNLGAFLLIGLGVLFLLGQIFDFSFFTLFDMSSFWPFFIIIPGAVFLVLALLGGAGMAALVFPGAIVTTTGAILYLQNASILPWEGWAYLWAVYPAVIGLGLIFVGRRTHQPEVVTNGGRVLLIGAVLLAVFAVFFEVIIFGGNAGILGSTLWRVGIPALLIVIGGLMLLNRNRQPAPLPKVKRTYTGPSAEVDPALKRKIDAALVEEDERV